MTHRRSSSSFRPFHRTNLRHLALSAVVALAGLGVALSGFVSATVAAPAARPEAVQRVARLAVVARIGPTSRGWYAFGTATRLEGAQARSSFGHSALRARLSRQTRSGGIAFDAGGRGVAVDPSTRYTLETWVRGTGKLRIRVGLHNEEGNAIGFARLSGDGVSFEPTSEGWTRYTVTFTAPPRARSIVVQVGGRERQRATFLIASMRMSARTLAVARRRPKGPRDTTTSATTTKPGTTDATTTSAGTTTMPPSTTGGGGGTPPPTTTTTTTTPPPTTAQTTTTTTTTTSTSSSSSMTYQQAIAYSQGRPAFTPLRQVSVSSAAQLLAAMSGLRCGDLITASTPFTVSSEWVINQSPTCPALVDLTGVTIAYTGSSALPSVWINGASNIWLYGGDIHGPAAGQPGAGGISVYQASNIRWWGFHVHDVAHDGLDLFPIGGAIDSCDFQGEIDHWGGYIADDPHAEKGTGFHGANVADAGTGIVTNTRLALYVHDGPTGAGVQIGTGSSSGRISGITLYLKAVNLTMQATSQVAGNALQEWGAVPIQMSVPYLEATNLQGRANDGQGVYTGVSMSGINVAYGRATNTNLNPYLSRTESGIAASDPWDKRRGQTYGNVLP